MSIAPYKPDPLTIPDVSDRVTGVPAAWWHRLRDYRAAHMAKLALSDRARINSAVYRQAERLLREPLFHARAARHTPELALRKLREDVEAFKRDMIEEARMDRAYALQVHGRVPCGAEKKDGWQCRAMSEPGRNRCRFHGGRSTGPRTIEGMRKALSCLPQYRGNPDALEARLATLETA